MVFGKEGCRMGNSASTSNAENILAVASPFSNAEGDHSGQVDMCEINDDTNAWNNTCYL